MVGRRDRAMPKNVFGGPSLKCTDSLINSHRKFDSMGCSKSQLVV